MRSLQISRWRYRQLYFETRCQDEYRTGRQQILDFLLVFCVLSKHLILWFQEMVYAFGREACVEMVWLRLAVVPDIR